MAGFDPSTYLDNDDALEEIINDIPKLISVRDFAQKTQTVRWFQEVGEAPDEELMTVARAYLDALGFPHVEIALIADWEDAESAAESPDWDTAGWEAEEQLRSALVSEALLDLSEEALSVALNHVSAAAGMGLQEHVENIAAIWDI